MTELMCFIEETVLYCGLPKNIQIYISCILFGTNIFVYIQIEISWIYSGWLKNILVNQNEFVRKNKFMECIYSYRFKKSDFVPRACHLC